MKTVDIIIPSFRVDPQYLIPIFEMKRPDCFDVSYIVVVDNPEVNFPDSLVRYAERPDISFIVNEDNLGAGLSRNVGLDNSSGSFVLFLDDDITPDPNLLLIYEKIICEDDEWGGYVGITEFPKPINSFTRGIEVSDMLTFFRGAYWMKNMPWGVTANLLLKRKVIGDNRFLRIFPKFGGGEDIELCLRILGDREHRLCPVPDARVLHDWWNNGKRSYTRFYRWARGDSLLPSIFEEYRYFNLPNVIELLTLAIVFAIISTLFQYSFPILKMSLSILIGEFIGEWFKIAYHKHIFSPISAFESMLIRASNDLGRFVGNIKRMHLTGLLERFDYFCNGEHIAIQRFWAAVKIMLTISTFLGMW